MTKESYHLLLDEFEKFRSTNKILDIGCGRGWFLIEAKKGVGKSMVQNSPKKPLRSVEQQFLQ
jgi:16S rRNA G1207 methylase RsmC